MPKHTNKSQASAAATRKGRRAARGYTWSSVETKLPAHGQRVICKYQGVYDARIVTFWRDTGNNAHFGLPGESDGKGSQPASHWMPLP